MKKYEKALFLFTFLLMTPKVHAEDWETILKNGCNPTIDITGGQVLKQQYSPISVWDDEKGKYVEKNTCTTSNTFDDWFQITKTPSYPFTYKLTDVSGYVKYTSPTFVTSLTHKSETVNADGNWLTYEEESSGLRQLLIGANYNTAPSPTNYASNCFWNFSEVYYAPFSLDGKGPVDTKLSFGFSDFKLSSEELVTESSYYGSNYYKEGSTITDGVIFIKEEGKYAPGRWWATGKDVIIKVDGTTGDENECAKTQIAYIANDARDSGKGGATEAYERSYRTKSWDTLGNRSAGAAGEITWWVHPGISTSDGNRCTTKQDPTDWVKGDYNNQGVKGVKVTGSCTWTSIEKAAGASCTTVYATDEGQTVQVTCNNGLGSSVTLSHTVKNIDNTAPKSPLDSSSTGSSTTLNVPKENSSGLGILYGLPDGGYVNTKVPVKIGCEDQGNYKSGCDSTSKDQIVLVKGDGSESITIRDIAKTGGNSKSYKITHNYWDSTAPEVTMSILAPNSNNNNDNYSADGKSNNGAVSVKITAKDEKSPIKQICYKINSDSYTCKAPTETSNNGKTGSITVDVDAEGVTTVTAKAHDKVYGYQESSKSYAEQTWGNISEEVSKKVYIDTTAPEISFGIPQLNGEDYDGSWINGSVNIDVSVSDKLGGSVYDADTKNAAGLSSITYVWANTNDKNFAMGTTPMAQITYNKL